MTYKIYTNQGDEIEFYLIQGKLQIEIGDGDGDNSEIASLSKEEAKDLISGLNNLLRKME